MEPVAAEQTQVKKLTLDDIIEMIDDNQGRGNIDLSGCDLSMIDLGWQAVAERLRAWAVKNPGTLPTWVSRFVRGRSVLGLNLRKANLSNANLRLSDLSGVDLSKANLKGAHLHDACLQYTNLYEANLEGAMLRRTDLRFARLGGANLRCACLYRAEMEETNMSGACLEEANLVMAKLEGAEITREKLGEHLLTEDPEKFAQAIKQQGIWRDPGEWEQYIPRRMMYLKDTYRALKSSFLAHGQYYDASWAYYQEQKCIRQMRTPSQARAFFGNKASQAKPGNPEWWKFHIQNFFTWLSYWAMELSCGYGEKPWRSILFSLAVILLFPFLYIGSGGLSLVGNQPPVWADYWIYSLGAFATVSFPRFLLTNPLIEFLTGVEGLMGISVLALLMFALGNRISRS